MDVFDIIRDDPRVASLGNALRAPRGCAFAEGLWGSAAPIVAAIVAERLGRPLLIITAHADEADDIRDDVETALGATPDLLPQLETMHAPGGDAADELVGERLRLCVQLLRHRAAPRGAAPSVIVAPILALMQPVPSAEAILGSSRELRVGETLAPEALARWLEEAGFSACEAVAAPGDYARRGGIVDVYSNAHADPLRVEFFGDQVESIRYFSPATQRSAAQLDAIQIPSLQFAPVAGERADPKATAGFLSHLPADTIIALQEAVEVQELGRSLWLRLGEPRGMIPCDAVFRRTAEFSQLFLQRFAAGQAGAVSLDVGGLPEFDAKPVDAVAALRDLSRECEVVVLCDNAAEEERFAELLAGEASAGAPAGPGAPPAPPVAAEPRAAGEIRTAIGVLHHGFRWGRRAFIPHHALFHRYRQRRTLRRVAPGRPIDNFFDLSPGDPVVHILHGIGRFQGLKTMERDGRTDEYLALEFAGGAVVHVPISQIHLVQKYIGSAKGKPTLSALGGAGWKKVRQRVAEAVGDLAAEMLAVQAQRATKPGLAFPADTKWQREFEESFLYVETPDQLRALGEIKRDQSLARPMDRLLCGDVGFGKTELAIRAVFKTVEFGKQVAVLVPTTVLAEQHYQTFRERFADYPFTVEVISRFRSPAEQRRIIGEARKGRIDVLIGTHRLLSADVKFADLGLVVIDEEQRFGVEAKERLKRLRSMVDVLTLSATPIPRTLHMSLLGIRDISSLATPPVDRRAIVTQVRSWDDALIREALIRELNRDGQAYFVHNFVRDIEEIANRLRTLVPEARFVVGHGQMGGPELEDVMLKFFHREADVLVSTNIIESGIDVPTANTMFINRAERFGLADLHQLRGRVGRSKHRAFCYLLLSPKIPISDVAARRLKAIEHYSDLGAGFQIAMRDLEIRGAGNILGAEQSGNIEAVGYEMYCQLLDQAVRRMKNEPADDFRPVNLDLGISATIPRNYIRADRQRMEVYRRLTTTRTLADLKALRDDLRDAFGPLPPAVETLLALAEVRVLAAPWKIRSLVLVPPDVVFSFDDLELVQPLFAEGPGSPRVPDPRTIHWRLPKRLLEGDALLDALRKQLAVQPRTASARIMQTAASVE